VIAGEGAQGGSEWQAAGASRRSRSRSTRYQLWTLVRALCAPRLSGLHTHPQRQFTTGIDDAGRSVGAESPPKPATSRSSSPRIAAKAARMHVVHDEAFAARAAAPMYVPQRPARLLSILSALGATLPAIDHQHARRGARLGDETAHAAVLGIGA